MLIEDTKINDLIMYDVIRVKYVLIWFKWRGKEENGIIAFFFPLMALLINLSWKINEPKRA